jgi:molybdopterin-guanine dinucleotide biosynthesis protein A
MEDQMTVCVILAGGRSRRMGGEDKGFLPLADEPLLAHVLTRIAPQTSAILINSNSDAAKYHGFGVPVAPDVVPGFHGPLAGLLTGMIWARETHDASHVLSVPCDTPFLPADLVRRLEQAVRRGRAEIAIARDAEHRHPVIGLWPVAFADKLSRDLAGGTRAIHRWLEQCNVCDVCFAAGHFHNINTRAELRQTTKALASPLAALPTNPSSGCRLRGNTEKARRRPIGKLALTSKTR